ncbi:AbrB/MazE/SpoVT family DNA-binding domain-containing protein [Pleurocapsa sp. PCC 7319]|uniref:AbrB/MazE/SpoVT family DNA-binding domain-containing protein n=1 Tax=Pleurocapsa sp. PCC 7319 TaxID=118161 RepID=UPI00034D45D3|nr:AbrB/MazE/SpoVT family DNA-binding domain-containing protein [Pleurocapsa sp. PCC 7319]
MLKIVTIGEHGEIILPKDLRRKYNLKNGGKIVIEDTEVGLLLRPGVTFSVEVYSSDRLKEFEEHNEADLKEFDFY